MTTFNSNKEAPPPISVCAGGTIRIDFEAAGLKTVCIICYELRSCLRFYLLGYRVIHINQQHNNPDNKTNVNHPLKGEVFWLSLVNSTSFESGGHDQKANNAPRKKNPQEDRDSGHLCSLASISQRLTFSHGPSRDSAVRHVGVTPLAGLVGVAAVGGGGDAGIFGDGLPGCSFDEIRPNQPVIIWSQLFTCDFEIASAPNHKAKLRAWLAAILSSSQLRQVNGRNARLCSKKRCFTPWQLI